MLSNIDNNEICISLDLETTGLNHEIDEIIEIGAVKFRDDEILGTFQTFVDPFMPIPNFIQELTNISQSDVNGAPSFATVSPSLRDFIGSHPIVGQNIYFDISFLNNQGLGLFNPSYDTRELATMLLPSLREYSLGSLASHLGIEHPNAHRALADAQVTQKVFQALVSIASGMGQDLLGELAILNNKGHNALSYVFERLKNSIAASTGSYIKERYTLDLVELYKRLGNEQSSIKKLSRSLVLNEDDIEDLFKEGGPIEAVLDNYKTRDPQIAMAKSVAHSILDEKPLLVEGGTGVGKSMAYLVPSMIFSITTGKRIVISTNTINLQEQLIYNDIPLLIRALQQVIPEFLDFRYSLLKGRDNYLCLKLWESIRKADEMTKEQARVASKILVWLQKTSTGDRSELNLEYRDTGIWNRFSASGSFQCNPNTKDICFLKNARVNAEASNIVVVNHSLLLRDLADGGGLIPTYDYVVVDEAHHLEDEATRQFGHKITQTVFDEYLTDMDGPNGLYETVKFISSSLALSSRTDTIIKILETGISLTIRIREHTDTFWASLSNFLKYQTEDNTEGRQQIVKLTRNKRLQPDWSIVEQHWENISLVLSEMDKELSKLSLALSQLDSGSAHETLNMKISNLSTTTTDLKNDLLSFLGPEDGSNIYWIAQENTTSEVTLNIAPLDIGDILRDKLHSKKVSSVFTSATLTTQGNFEYVKDRLGIDDAQELILSSPFDYKTSVLVSLPDDAPDPNSTGYQDYLQRSITQICEASDGRTMALFTSHASLRAVRSGIKAELNSKGYQVLAQSVDGTPGQILRSFQSNPKSVLLGTASFWEGIDLPKGSLKSLILTRLPFNVPSEPVFASRSQRFKDPFKDYSLPQAILRFRQGFGRLIRRESDRGVVVMLDRRLVSRRYGKAFLESLPDCTFTSGIMRDLPRVIKQWLSKKP